MSSSVELKSDRLPSMVPDYSHVLPTERSRAEATGASYSGGLLGSFDMRSARIYTPEELGQELMMKFIRSSSQPLEQAMLFVIHKRCALMNGSS